MRQALGKIEFLFFFATIDKIFMLEGRLSTRL